eukprot:scaffold4569_cov284-Chaetoceros_neogracile.AAC.8
MIGGMKLVAPYLLLLAFASTSLAEDCACNPSSYVFDINLNNTCDDFVFSDIGIDTGNLHCFFTDSSGVPISNADEKLDNIANFSQVVFTELGFGIGQTAGSSFPMTGPFADGSTLEPIESIISANVNFTGNIIPVAYGLKITAIANFGSSDPDDEVRLEIIIGYTNECDAEPLFTQGDKFAWFEFNQTASGDIVPEFCFLPSLAPSLSSSPTISPSPTALAISSSPSALPSEDCDDGKSGKGKGGKGSKCSKKSKKMSKSKSFKSKSSKSKSFKSKSSKSRSRSSKSSKSIVVSSRKSKSMR